MTTATVTTLTCLNPLCPEVVRTRRPQFLGQIVGTEAHVPCPRCRQVTHWRLPASLARA